MTIARSYYDVVVVGGSLAALAAGALLARRGFRIAWIRHHDRPNTYSYDNVTLRRAPEMLPFTETPVFRAIASELALIPVVKRRQRAIDPLFQVALPGHRIDVHAGAEPLLTELEREFPELRRPMEAFYTDLARDTAALDELFGPERVWPPEGFFERRSHLRAAHRISSVRDANADPFGDFPAQHPFRAFVEAQTRFATAVDPDRIHPLRVLRAHGSALRSASVFEGGRDGFARLLEEKIVQHGGDVHPRETAARIVTERGRIKGVDLAHADERLGCTFVLTSLDDASAYRLAEHSAGDAAAEALLSHEARYYRYTLNLVLAPSGIPAGMATRVYHVLDRQRPLCEENLSFIECAAPEADGRIVVTVQSLLPRASVEEGESYLHKQRARVVQSLRDVIPFLDRNLRIVDSPHDGLPLEDRARGESVLLPERRREPMEPMRVLESVAPDALLGVVGTPFRTEIRNLLTVGPQVLPGLGEEGEWLAAAAVARVVTKSDPTKERLRRG